MSRSRVLSVFFALLIVAIFSTTVLAGKTVIAEEGYIPVTGGKVFYRMVGIGSPGTPMLVLHGGPGSNLDPFYTTEVLGEDRPIIYYNQLGSKKSDFELKDESLLTVERYVEEVGQVIEALGLKEVIIMGHSWGSMLATEYYLRKNPEHVKGMILVGPFLSVDVWLKDAQNLIKKLSPENQKIIEECEAKKDFDNPEYQKAVDEFYHKFLFRAENWPEVMDSPMNVFVYEYMWGPSEFTSTGTLLGADLTPKLKDIKVPVLYVCGEFDEATPETTKYYSSLTPGSEVHIVEGAGHMSPTENPQDFNKAVGSFLKKNDSTK